jgi:hypothetical protein
MSSSRDAVRCTVHHGAMWMHLENVSVKIPQEFVNKSQILTNALSVAHPSVARKVTVAAPREWLEAWAICYCNKEVRLSCEDINDLANCLLVCFLRQEHISDRDHSQFCFRYCGHRLSSARRNNSSMSESPRLVLFCQLLPCVRLLIRDYGLQEFLRPLQECWNSNDEVSDDCRQLTFLPFRATYRTYVAPWQPDCLHVSPDTPRTPLNSPRHRCFSACLRNARCFSAELSLL